MGKAAALTIVENGGKCLLVSRSESKLQAARQYLLDKVPKAEIEIFPLDIKNEAAVIEFAEQLMPCWDSLVISAAGKVSLIVSYSWTLLLMEPESNNDKFRLPMAQ